MVFNYVRLFRKLENFNTELASKIIDDPKLLDTLTGVPQEVKLALDTMLTSKSFYKAMLEYQRPDLKDVVVPVTKMQKKKLELLLMTPDFAKSLKKFDEFSISLRYFDENETKRDPDYADANSLFYGFMMGMTDVPGFLKRYRKESDEVLGSLLTHGKGSRSPQELKEDLSEYTLKINHLERFIARIGVDPTLKAIKKGMDKMFSLKHPHKENFIIAISGDRENAFKRFLSNYKNYISLSEESFAKEFYSLRLRRAKELSKVNEDIASAYLGFGPCTVCESKGKNTSGCGNHYNTGTFAMFMNEDLKYYMDLVESLQVVDHLPPKIEKIVEPLPEKKTVKRQPAPILPGLPDAPRVVKVHSADHDYHPQLMRAIMKDKDSLTEDMSERIRYFVYEDVGFLKSPEQSSLELSDSLHGLNLAHRFREHVPSEIQFRTFFDDVTLNYLRKDKIPTVSELVSLYESDCGYKKK